MSWKSTQLLTFHRQHGSRQNPNSTQADSQEHTEMVPGPHLPETANFLITDS